MPKQAFAFVLIFLSAAGACGEEGDSGGTSLSEEALGEQLFQDMSLSLSRSQACESCHNLDHGSVDVREDDAGRRRATSVGGDGQALGDRNAPPVTYAQFSPEFTWGTRMRFNTDGDFSLYEGYLGGQFFDGRAAGLEEQAAQPPLNPLEMAMPSKSAVVDRLLENGEYEVAFKELYGADVWDDVDSAYLAMTQAIAAFERTDRFAPFDSRYDRSLLSVGDSRRYEYDPASLAAAGKALFFSKEFTNCAACHQLHPQGSADARREVFSGFEYHNLGVPENRLVRDKNGAPTDLGLGAELGDEALDGKFKTPSLRNVAVTAPYMHNGVFHELATVIRFYEHAKQRARGRVGGALNPETGRGWGEPEVDRNLSTDELASGNKDLTDERNVRAIECFLLTLTDARYESLLDANTAQECGL